MDPLCFFATPQENLDFKVHRGTGELSADSVLRRFAKRCSMMHDCVRQTWQTSQETDENARRIGESESGIWSFVNLGAEQSQELMPLPKRSPLE